MSAGVAITPMKLSNIRENGVRNLCIGQIAGKDFKQVDGPAARFWPPQLGVCSTA